MARRDEQVDPELRLGHLEPALPACAAEDADEVRAGPFEDLADGPPRSAPAAVVDPHRDAVPVHGRAEIAGADVDVFVSLVGDDEGRAALDPLQPAADAPATSGSPAAPGPSARGQRGFASSMSMIGIPSSTSYFRRQA